MDYPIECEGMISRPMTILLNSWSTHHVISNRNTGNVTELCRSSKCVVPYQNVKYRSTRKNGFGRKSPQVRNTFCWRTSKPLPSTLMSISNDSHISLISLKFTWKCFWIPRLRIFSTWLTGSWTRSWKQLWCSQLSALNRSRYKLASYDKTTHLDDEYLRQKHEDFASHQLLFSFSKAPSCLHWRLLTFRSKVIWSLLNPSIWNGKGCLSKKISYTLPFGLF